MSWHPLDEERFNQFIQEDFWNNEWGELISYEDISEIARQYNLTEENISKIYYKYYDAIFYFRKWWKVWFAHCLAENSFR